MNLKSFITTLVASVLLLVSVAQNVYAKDENMENYLEKNLNPYVNKVVKKYNNTLKENWYYNLSNYLLKKDKDSTIEKLETLRKDIKALKKEVKKIKGPKSAGKKDKKSIKATKKHLTKALNKTDTDAKKLIKNIKKDKKIKTISDRNTEKSRVAKASKEYSELNKKYDIETKELKLNEFIKINENIAKSFINKQEKEKKKLKEKKKAQKKEVKHKKAAEETKKREEQQKREEEKQKTADKLNEVVQELINMGEGTILDIKPTSGDDWIATYVYIDNSWYLLSEEEKKYVVENIGPVVESKIIETGVVDYCDVYFVDQNGNTVASPKMLGGYKINN